MQVVTGNIIVLKIGQFISKFSRIGQKTEFTSLFLQFFINTGPNRLVYDRTSWFMGNQTIPS